MTRKAQQSRREQPATPSSGPVTPRGELIHHDNKEKPDPTERRQREDTWQTQRHPATDTSASPFVRTGGEEDHRRHLQPQGLLSTQQQGQMVASGKAPCSGQNGGFRIKLFTSLFVSEWWKRAGESRWLNEPSRLRKTCLCGGAFVEIKDYHA